MTLTEIDASSKHGCFDVSFHTRTTLSTVPKARHEVGDSAKEVKTLGA
jgi:hypothetical protein